MSSYTVYVHTNKVNGMKYVGITGQDPKARWAHGYGYHKQSHFFNAIKHYGWDGFTHEIVATGLSLKEAATEEERLISLYKTTNRQFGYNKSTGGEAGARGVELSAENRAKRSETLKRLWENPAFRERRRVATIELNKRKDIREKRSAASMGRSLTQETREKISEHRRGVKPPPFSDEHRAKMREHHAGGVAKSPVICIETGKTYASINDASRATGINKKGISGCCRKVEHYNTAGGYHWEFA